MEAPKDYSMMQVEIVDAVKTCATAALSVESELLPREPRSCQIPVDIKKLRWTLAGDMTAAAQLTDLMIARPVKSTARKEMPRIRQWLKQRAKKDGKEVSYKVGALEILMIAKAIDEYLEKWLEGWDFIFHGIRQGGHLAYLPDLEKESSSLWRRQQSIGLMHRCHQVKNLKISH